MATERKGRQPPQQLDRKILEQLIFGTGRVRRFTQDSPVLPDVWLEYAKGPEDRASRLTTLTDPDDPFPPVKLLLTPYREHSAGDVRRELRQRLENERGTAEWQAFEHAPEPMPRVAYNQTTVAATLHFEDLIRVVLPMTDWWARLDRQWKIDGAQSESVQETLAKAVEDPEHPPTIETGKGDTQLRLQPALLWMIRVAGALAIYHYGRPLPPGFGGKEGAADAKLADWTAVTAAVAQAIRGITPYSGKARIYSISLNREATPTISRSTLAIKADAARRLFNIACGELAWAIVDSGVDAGHPAFRQRRPDGTAIGEPFADKDEKGEKKAGNFTRVVATYDFSQIDLLLDPDTAAQPSMVEEQLAAGSPEKAEEMRTALEDLNNAMASGRTLDWKLIAPLLSVPHEEGKYKPPGMDHGTHVAGILASDWRSAESGDLEEDLSGVCPDLRLYDFRVLDADGRGDEFTVMAALQFIRYLNSTNDFMVVHGANLSLSIPHDISNYACGRTPVCEECERVVNSGVVVVAAAGNQGYRKYTTAEG
ncbi:MAG TPA: S8 family serine peptidase, partial [Thermoanaerobaculia bacterium]|nr:S8 family serine peptidase [Thermoanaerobaculia bacterium]